MRRLLIMVVVPVVVLVLAQLAVWFVAAGRLEGETLRWIAARQDAGWTVATGAVERHGWPFAVALRVADVAVAAPAGGVAYDAQTLELRVSLFHPFRLTAMIRGPQHLRLPGQPMLQALAERTEADIPIGSGATPRQGDLAIDALRVEIPGTGTVTLAHLTLHAEWPMADPAATFRLDAEALYPPVGVSQAFDHGISRITLDGALAGPWPALPPTAAGLAAWRDGGGALALRQVDVSWGKVAVHGSARLALDGKLQPAGTAQVRVTGHGEAVDALAKDGVITARAAQAAKGVLGLLARPAEGGGSVVEVPLTLQDRGLQLGRIPLMRMPEIMWQPAS